MGAQPQKLRNETEIDTRKAGQGVADPALSSGWQSAPLTRGVAKTRRAAKELSTAVSSVISSVRGHRNRRSAESSLPDGLVYVAHYKARCKPDPLLEASFGWCSPGHSVFPKNILPSQPAEISFVSPHNGLTSVEVTFGLHGRQNTCTLTATLREYAGAGGRVVFQAPIRAQGLGENSPYEIQFPERTDSRGKFYTLTISAPGATPDNCVAVWGSLLPRDEQSNEATLRNEAGEIFSACDFNSVQLDLTPQPNSSCAARLRPAFRTLFQSGDLIQTERGDKNISHSALAAPLISGRVMDWRVECDGDGLSGIGLFFDQQGRTNSCRLTLEIFRDEAALTESLRTVQVRAADLTPNGIAWFRFEPIPLSRGQSYVVRLVSPDANKQNHLVFFGALLEPARHLPDSAKEIREQSVERRFIELPLVGKTTSDIFAPRFAARSMIDGLQFATAGWGGYSLELLYAELLPDRPIEVTFLAPGPDLFQLSFLTGTSLRENSCTITLELFEHQGAERALCRSVAVSGVRIPNNEFADFTFKPIGDSQGRWYTARLSSHDASPENNIAFYGSALKRDTALFEKLPLSPDRTATSLTDFRRTGPDLERFLAGPRLRSNWCVNGFDVERSHFLVVAGTPLTGEQKQSLSELCDWMTACGGSATFADADSFAEGTYGDLLDFDAVVFFELPWEERFSLPLRALRHATIPVIAALEELPEQRLRDRLGIPLDEPIPSGEPKVPPPKSILRNRALWAGARSADFFWAPTGEVERIARDLVRHPILFDWRHPDSESTWKELLTRSAVQFRAQKFPKMSLVTVLYGKEREIPAVLESYFRQTYLGEFELIFVDDCSPDKSVELVRQYQAAHTTRADGETPAPPIRILCNKENTGNCGSRNSGLQQATGDVFVIIDADCMVNGEFLEAHAREYADGGPDAVIGFLNIESGAKEPLDALADLEASPELLPRLADLQDPITRSSFLNCITRNFSVRREAVTETLFDDLFAYSRKPDSGYGWEDVEMGYRLYKSGATIRFSEKAFSVHISHQSFVDESTKPLRSLKNFRRLLTKHPELAVISRRWVLDTYGKLSRWCDSHSLPENDDRRAVDHALARWSHLALKTAPRRLRVLTYRWHAAHQYELYRTGHDFTLVRFPTPSFTNSWSYEERPFPDNARFADIDSIRFSDYDVALVHFDENVLATWNTNGVLWNDWGANFRWFMTHVPLPKIGICHGTPQFKGQYDFLYEKHDLGTVLSEERDRLVRAVGDMPVVVNSHQAQREWGFQRSHVIWHGFDPAEYQQTSYADGVLSIGRPMKSRPHYRGYFLAERVTQLLPVDVALHALAVDEPDAAYAPHTNEFAVQKFENYRKNIRRYSVYFNPTLHSPMPRSRAEAMLCGLTTVNANTHDVELFVKNGVNGFYSSDPEELADYLLFLHRSPESAKSIGAKGRQTAQDIFNHDRYLNSWQNLLSEATGTKV
ncbi:MAG: glycosyltransferase [Bdellovibrionota bacterium]